MKDRSELCSANKKKVFKEYGMTPLSISRDVEAIKQWLMKQPHLPKIKPELLSIQVDDWLENYLIACKNSMEKVKEGLDMYFTSKILLPEIFACRDALTPSFEKSFEVMSVALVPDLTKEGRKLIVFSHNKNSADDFDPIVMFKRVSMMMDILLLEGVDFLGLEFAVDCKNVSLSHVGRYNFAFTKKVLDISMKGLPQRIHKIHMVNPPSYIDTCISVFKPVLTKKINERFSVHNDIADFVQSVGAKAAPSDLGGENETIESLNRLWQRKLIDYRSWFETTRLLQSDESKRIGKCRYETDTTFGNQGSFRKIEVD